MSQKAYRLLVRGTVQGVGFRPFIFRLATSLGFSGYVKNIGQGVEIHLEAEQADFEAFLRGLRSEAPPLARIESVDYQEAQPLGLKSFLIEHSSQEESFVFIAPDIATCEECLKEIEKPEERRYRYPFTNCTNCGPRYTIVKGLPYDREKTTMARFKMCPECQREYEDPRDRRYHAQPIACPRCGPQIVLIESRTGKTISESLDEAIKLIKKGKIIAIKGLGGFHLVGDATNPRAVTRLRKIKQRKTKPLALMAKNLETIKMYARLNAEEKKWLISSRRPILLLTKKRDLAGISPGIDTFGLMLPYTPLHYLITREIPLIIATSSNRKDAPIIKDRDEIKPELCDFILNHNREIAMRADDSVMKVVNGRPLFFRRARGFVPFPQPVPESLKAEKQILAVGGELKNTISIYKNGYIITSQFLGDLDDYENFDYFQETLSHLKKLFSFSPEIVVSDLHPDFRSTRFARRLGIPHLQIQHHFAHTLAPLIEHQIQPRERVLGVSFDGFGLGQDGQAWGGEFLLAEYSDYVRYAHFDYVPLPGGDMAAKEPWRMALVYLRKAFGPNIPVLKPLKQIPRIKQKSIWQMMESGLNSPLTSSAGRLFDAVSFLCGLAPCRIEYEAEAPSLLEAAAARCQEKIKKGYHFSLLNKSLPYKLDFRETIQEIVSDLKKEVKPEIIALKFHLTLVQSIVEVAEQARKEEGLKRIVLTGGVFLNRLLTEKTERLLQKKGFSVLRPTFYSPNDESISLGQIAYVLNRLKNLSGKPENF